MPEEQKDEQTQLNNNAWGKLLTECFQMQHYLKLKIGLTQSLVLSLINDDHKWCKAWNLSNVLRHQKSQCMKSVHNDFDVNDIQLDLSLDIVQASFVEMWEQ